MFGVKASTSLVPRQNVMGRNFNGQSTRRQRHLAKGASGSQSAAISAASGEMGRAAFSALKCVGRWSNHRRANSAHTRSAKID
jgi:hypothetical protein